jgi:hypothetical protein
MATDAYSNYESSLTKGGTLVGPALVLDFPEMATQKIPTTNHGSGHYGEGIPSGLIILGDITVSVIIQAGTLTTMQDEMEARLVNEIVLADVLQSMTFDGFYLSVKKEPADAQAPDVIKATVVISPTGPLTITDL